MQLPTYLNLAANYATTFRFINLSWFTFFTPTLILGFVSLLFFILRLRFKLLIGTFASAFILNLVASVISYDHGDFAGSGFPFPYIVGTWGMGMTYAFILQAYLVDLVFWFGFIQLFTLLKNIKPLLINNSDSSFKRLVIISPCLILIIVGITTDIISTTVKQYQKSTNEKIFNAAINQQNSALCEKLNKPTKAYDNTIYSNCIYRIATSTNNPQLCRKQILFGDEKYMLPECISQIAQNTLNPEICSEIDKNSSYFANCYRHIAVQVKNSQICNQSPEPDICFFEYSSEVKDRSACNLIKSESQRNICNNNTYY